jgi:transglutaminase-like putative cysteine protease
VRNSAFLATVFLALCWLPFWSQHPIGVNFACLILGAVGFWHNRAGRKLAKPLGVALLLLALIVAYVSHGKLRGFESWLSVLLILCSLKLFELGTKRDIHLMYSMGLLLFVGHLLSAESILLIALVLALGIGAFLGLEYLERGDVRAIPWPSLWPLFSVGFLGALIAFFFFPRIYVGNFALGFAESMAKVGFEQSLRPGEVSELALDRTPVFRVSFDNDKIPSMEEMYWRGAVLGETDGLSWVRGRFQAISEIVPNLNSPRYAYEVTYDQSEQGAIFVLEGTASVERKGRGLFLKGPGETYRMGPMAGEKIRYHAISYEWESLPLDVSLRERYLALPEFSERMKQIATEFVQQFPDEERRMRAITESFFDRGFRYTLAPGRYPEGADIEHFMFNSKIGFCEHFASATAILARLSGIPARVVVGFQGGQYNGLGEYFLVRNMDAHAWVEAYFEGKGWKRFDPTGFLAPERLSQGAEGLRELIEREENEWGGLLRGRYRRFFSMVDMVYYQANQYFLGFDAESQQRLLRLKGSPWRTGPWLLFLSGFVICLVTAVIWWFVARAPQKSALERSYGRLQRHVKRRIGLERLASEGVLNFAIRIQEELPDSSRLLREYSQLRYGRDIAPAQIAAFALAVQKLTKQERPMRS